MGRGPHAALYPRGGGPHAGRGPCPAVLRRSTSAPLPLPPPAFLSVPYLRPGGVCWIPESGQRAERFAWSPARSEPGPPPRRHTTRGRTRAQRPHDPRRTRRERAPAGGPPRRGRTGRRAENGERSEPRGRGEGGSPPEPRYHRATRGGCPGHREPSRGRPWAGGAKRRPPRGGHPPRAADATAGRGGLAGCAFGRQSTFRVPLLARSKSAFTCSKNRKKNEKRRTTNRR